MLNQQQVALSALTDTLKSIQDDLKTNRMCAHLPEVVPVKMSTIRMRKRKWIRFNSFRGQSEDDTAETPAKQNKQDSSEGEKRENASISKLTKLDNLFSDKSEHGPKVHENFAKSLIRGISTEFSIKTALEFGENYKNPENCEYLPK